METRETCELCLLTEYKILQHRCSHINTRSCITVVVTSPASVSAQTSRVYGRTVAGVRKGEVDTIKSAVQDEHFIEHTDTESKQADT